MSFQVAHSYIFFDPEGRRESLTALLRQAPRSATPSAFLLLVAAQSPWLNDPQAFSIFEEFADLNLGGAIFPNLLYQGKIVEQGVLLVYLPHRVQWQIFTETAASVLQEHPPQIPQETQTIFCFYEWHRPVEDLLAALYHQGGVGIHFIGGGAGIWSGAEKPFYLFTAQQAAQRGALIGYSPLESSIGAAHGWTRFSQKRFTVTKMAEKNELCELDGQSAWDVYGQFLRMLPDEDLRSYEERQVQGNLAFGIPSPWRDELRMNTPIEIVLKENPLTQKKDYHFLLGAPLSVGTRVYIMIAHREYLLQATQNALAEAQRHKNPAIEYPLTLVFGCYDRCRIIQTAAFAQEMQQVAETYPQFLGAVCIGEIGSNGMELPVQHNETMTVALLADHNPLQLQALLEIVKQPESPRLLLPTLMAYLKYLGAAMIGLYQPQLLEAKHSPWKLLACVPASAPQHPHYQQAQQQLWGLKPSWEQLPNELLAHSDLPLAPEGTLYYLWGIPTVGVLVLLTRRPLVEEILHELRLIHQTWAKQWQAALSSENTHTLPTFHPGQRLKLILQERGLEGEKVLQMSRRSLQRWYAEGIPAFQIPKIAETLQIPSQWLTLEHLTLSQLKEWLQREARETFLNAETPKNGSAP